MLHLTGERKYPHGCQPRLISIAMMVLLQPPTDFKGNNCLWKCRIKRVTHRHTCI